MIWKLLATALLMSPLVAKADPAAIAFFLLDAGFSAATALAAATAASWVAANAFYLTVVSLNVFGAANARRKAKAEAARQRRQANAALTDRAITALSATPPWRIVYGEAIVGGDIVAVFTSDKQTISDKGNPYTKKDAYKHIVVHIASHRCQAIEDVIIEGVRLGQLDVNGWVKNTALGTGKNYVFATSYPVGATSLQLAAGTGTILVGDEIVLAGDSNRYRVVTGISAPGVVVIAAPGLQQAVSSGTPVYLGSEFSTQKKFPRTGTIGAGATLTITDGVVGDIVDAYTNDGDGYSTVSVTVSPDRKQITNSQPYAVSVNYEVVVNQSTVRVSKHLGDPDQLVDSYLNSLFPVEWDSSHRLRGRTYAVITLDLEEQRFQGGPPTMSFVVKGKNDVYDPRTSTTGYTSNSALIIGDWLCAPWGFDCDRVQDINTDYWIACANACDESVTFETLMPNGSTLSEVGPRFTSNGAFTTEESKEQVLESLADSMGGAVVYGAQWLMFAGVWTPPVTFDDGSTSLTDDDLMGPIEFPQASAGMDDLVNGIRGTFLEKGKLSPTDFDPYQNAAFKADDGEDLFDDVTLPWTNTKPRCKNLARILTERNRDSQVMTVPAKLKAFKLQVGDRFTLVSEEYGINKTVRVTDWQFDIANAVTLTVQEDHAGVYDEADAAVSDPYPNTGLPSPFQVNELKNLVATSGVGTMERRVDGVMMPRVLLTWDPVDSPYVAEGQGYIEFRWKSSLNPDSAWTYVRAQGGDVSAYLTGMKHDTPIFIEGVVYNSLGRPSAAVIKSHVVSGDPGGPAESVTGLAVSVSNGQIRWSWASSLAANYGCTEVRLADTGWTLNSPAPLFRGTANSFTQSVSAAGTYTLYFRHVTVGEQPSTTSSSLSIVVKVSDLAVLGSASGAMNSDPTCERAAAWQLVNGPTLIQTSEPGSVGVNAIHFAGSAANGMAWSTENIPINPGRRYSLRARLYAAAGNNRRMYIVVRMFRANGTELTGADTGWGGSYAGYTYGDVPTSDGVFREYGLDFGVNTSKTIPSDVAYCRVGVWAQYSTTGSSSVAQAAQDIRLVDVTEARAANDAASAASAAASSAQASANTANSLLADIASDGKLTPVEKAQVRLEWDAIYTERAGIRAQADTLGITTEKTTYDTAFQALGNHLHTSTYTISATPPLIINDANLGVTSNITGSTFRGFWTDLYAARQALLNKIADVASTKAQWASVTSRPSNLSALSGSEAIQNTQITINGSGQVSGIGSGNLTTVSNGQIGINGSGQVTGIGAGNLTPVSNNQMSLTTDGRLLNGGTEQGRVTPRNFLDASWWAPGVLATEKSWPINDSGGNSTNVFHQVTMQDKHTQGPVWRATETGTVSGPAGGWNPGGDGNWFPPDKTRTYMFAVYVRKVAGSALVYWGVLGNTVTSLNSSALASNPYFVNAANLATADRWYLMVGYIYPSGVTSLTNQGAGLYDCETGQLIQAGSNYNWAPGVTYVGTRALHFYATQNSSHEFSSPMAFLCDGSEPALSDLLSMAAVSNRNPINSVNVSTYISAAAIGWAQIGSLDISTTGWIRSGKTTYGAGTGWIIEYNAGVPRLDIGSSDAYLRWTGTQLEIKIPSTNLVSTGVQNNRNFTSHAMTLGASGTATATAYIYNDGTLRTKANAAAVVNVGNWYAPTTTSIGSSYWVRFTKTSGIATGSFGLWLALSSNQSVSLSRTSLGEEYSTVTYEISDNSSGTNILASGTISLSAIREA